MDDCDGFYTFLDGGYHDIYQVVIDENGCSDTAWAKVAVEGFTFYAPNAFTPNADGHNDVWLPVSLGVTQYEMTIYNRWGESIFYTEDHNQPWIGNVHSGTHFAQDGVYLYRVIIHDLLSFPHEFTGHISLIR
jgi:gliding motility-associated-like protein